MSLALTLVGVCLLAIFSVYFLLNRRISQILDADKLLEKVDEEINGLILDMNQTAERNILLLEDKIKDLNALVRESEKMILLLNREMDRREEQPAGYAHLSKKRKMVREPVKSDENQNEKNKILDLYNQGMAPQIIAAKTGTSIGEVELIITLNSRKG